MNHYDWTSKLNVLYHKALGAHRGAERDASRVFTKGEVAELWSIGLRPIHVFDYAEDFASYGEPAWEEFLLVAAVRRDYFLYEQHRADPGPAIREQDLPLKTEEIEGIAWLPRIFRKAQCYLAGTLTPEIMYGCGGDRRFLKERDVHLGDFLRMSWAAKGDISHLLEYFRAK
jgi:hypothetical protein